MMTMKPPAPNTPSSSMERFERRGAMAYARTLLADTKVPGNSTFLVVGAAYDAALAAARAVCDVASYEHRSDLETFLDAANKLSLDELWRAEAPEQTKRHNRESRLFCEEVVTEADAALTVRWVDAMYKVAEAHLRTTDPGLL